MQEKLKAIEFNIRSILRRIEQLNAPENVDYEMLQIINKISAKVYELSEVIEEIEALEEMQVSGERLPVIGWKQKVRDQRSEDRDQKLEVKIKIRGYNEIQ